MNLKNLLFSKNKNSINHFKVRQKYLKYSIRLLSLTILICFLIKSSTSLEKPTITAASANNPQHLRRIKHDTPINTDDNNPNNINELPTEQPKQFDPKELLQVKIVNKSVNYYKTQFTRVRASLQDQLNGFISQFKKGLNINERFSPELKAKLNETFFQFINDLELSPYCLASLNHLRLEIKEKRLWPLKFIDAMEFIPTGILEGVFSLFGLYDECIAIESPMVKWNGIRGKYCMAKVRLPFLMPAFLDPDEESLLDNDGVTLPPKTISSFKDLNTYHGRKQLMEKLNRNFELMNNKLRLLQMINMFNGSYIRVGLCIPSTCSSFELENAINKFLDPIENPLRVEIEEECSYKGQEYQLDSYQLVAIFLLTSLALLVGACTAYEYYKTHFVNDDEIHKNPYDEYILSFSAINNTKKLMTIDDGDNCDNNDEQCRRLYSIDTIVMAFILLEFVGRSYVMPIFFGMLNVKRAQNGLQDQYFTAKKFFFLRGGSLAVTTYILYSAILLAYNICAHKSQIKPSILNYLKFALNRYLSLARRLIGPILLVYLMPLMGEGPTWHYFSELVSKPCKNNLWPTLLFFNNYAKSMDEVCIAPSVIFSALFYLSLLAPFLLYSLNHKYYGYIGFIVLIILGVIIQALPKLVWDLPVAPYEISRTSSVAEAKLSFIHYYSATDQYVTVFVIGLFIGYLIKCKPKINLGKLPANIALWIGLMALPFISTQWSERFKAMEGNFSQFSFVAWFLLSKIMWSCGFGWIVFSCCTNRANPLNEILSLSWLRPFGKLALGVYLNHITVLSFRQLTKKVVTPLNHLEILTNDISDIVMAFFISYVFYLLIERPFYYWIKFVFRLYPEKSSTRFSVCDLENGKLNDKEETIDLKPLNDLNRSR